MGDDSGNPGEMLMAGNRGVGADVGRGEVVACCMYLEGRDQEVDGPGLAAAEATRRSEVGQPSTC